MDKQLIIKALVSILFIAMLGQCASNRVTEDNYTYVYDASVENTTGRSQDLYEKDGKHRGMSVFRLRGDTTEPLDHLVKCNIESAAIVPFLFQETDTTKVLRARQDLGRWKRRDSMLKASITAVQSRGMEVFLKPHIWMHKGWRSNIQMDNAQEWDTWFDSYNMHMLHYAKMAEELDVEMYCIGTELRTSIKAQPERWSELIADIKAVYSGKLTYAANWDDDVAAIPFWKDLDYVGIQAYYPLTNDRSPELSSIKSGWNRHVLMLEKMSKQLGKKILFTEIGYRSDVIATIKPWLWDSTISDKTNKICVETQNLAYEAVYQKLWSKDWFAGMYWWQWHVDHTEDHSYSDGDFTPKFKPAENTMAKWYGRSTVPQ